MKYILISLITILTACSSNFAEKKTIINSSNDLLKLNAEICNKFKSDQSKLWLWIWIEFRFRSFKNKSLLNAKINVADVVGSSILKSEKQTRTENTKGVTSKYRQLKKIKF